MNDTSSHAAARTLVRPLVGTWVRPNHITSVRLATGAVACLLLARGGAPADENFTGTGERVFEGAWGFQPDDALYLLPLFVWAHWLAPMLLAAAGVTTVIALIIFARYLLEMRRPPASRLQ